MKVSVENNMAEMMSLKDVGFALRKRIKLIFGLTIFSLSLSWIITYFVLTPTYQSSAMLLVNRTLEVGEMPALRDLYSNEELMNTYHAIITSPRILNQVIEQLTLEDTTKTLRKRIIVESEGDSQVVSIRVRDGDPQKAMQIANSIATIFQREIVDLMNINNVIILAEAEVETIPISPIPLFNLTVAFVAGLMLSIGLSLILEVFDNTIKSEAEVERLLNLPVLGTVMEVDVKREKLVSKKQFRQEIKVEGKEHETIDLPLIR